MNPLRRFIVVVCFGAIIVLVALTFYPPSYRLTRIGMLLAGAIVWFGLIGLAWRQRAIRWSLLGLTLLGAILLSLPSRGRSSHEELRTEYVRHLLRYDGVTYYWGGESSRGIDCSGLIRRGLIDALICRGIQTMDAGLVREGVGLWWNDCSASALGEQYKSLTSHVLATQNINTLDHSRILPGDLAVTANGMHILAYLGENRWIEADPLVSKVVIATAPSKDNLWLDSQMRIVRWQRLQNPH